MMTHDEVAKLVAFRTKVHDAINRWVAHEPHCKSYEGQISLHFPSAFEPDGEIILEMHCYVLGPGRHYNWSGRSVAECLDVAGPQVDGWIRENDEQIAEESK